MHSGLPCPPGWTSTRLIDAFDIDLGKMLNPTAASGGSLKPYLANRNVQWNRFELEDISYMDFSESERKDFRLREGDLLVCEGGEIGRTAIWNEEIPECYFQKAIHRLRPREETTIDPRFMLHYMKHAIERNLFQGLIGQTSIAHLTRERLADFHATHPVSLTEQRRITEILDSADDQIKLSSRLLAKRESTLSSFEFTAVRDAAFSPSVMIGEIISNIPDGFIQTGPFGSQLHAYEYTDTGVPVVMPQDILGKSISDDKIVRIPEQKAHALSRHRMLPGDVVFGRRGDLGRCAVVDTSQAGWLCGTGCLLARIPNGPVLPEWLALAYRHDIGQRQVLARAVGSTMINLNTKIISEIMIPVPDIEDQKRKISAIAVQRKSIAQLSLEIDKLRTLKQGLMDDLLTGRVRVPIG